MNEIRAIADLTDPIESWWRYDADPASTGVKERIFLISWRDFFDITKLSEWYRDILKNHASSDLLVGVGHVPIDTGMREQLEWGFTDEFENAVGYNMLLIAPDIVGRYIHGSSSKNPERKFLKILRDQRVYDKASYTYDLLKSINTVAVSEKNEGPLNLKRKWMKKLDVGRWKWDNQPVHGRDAEYFDKYDMHIRAWVPNYDEFIRKSAEVVMYEALELIRESSKANIKILEVGFGTGAMTLPLLSWIDSLNRPVLRVKSSPLIEYCGIDIASDSMIPLMRKHFKIDDFSCVSPDFEQGNFWRSMGANMTRHCPFDIICGSLVLHDLLESENVIEVLDQMLEEVSDLLCPEGRMIFADVFVGGDIVARNWWFKWMTQHGLSEPDAGHFLIKNDEMINTIKKNDAKVLAEKHNFDCEFIDVGDSSDRSPFKIVVFTKLPVTTKQLVES